MAITFVDEEVGTANSTDLTISVPTGVQDDDVLIAFVKADGAYSWTSPGGWTEVEDVSAADGRSMTAAIYYKVASSESGSYTFTFGASEDLAGGVMAFRGADTSTPLDVTYNSSNHYSHGANDSTPPNPSITTSTDGAWVLVMDSNTHGDISAAGAPTNYTLRASNVDGYHRFFAVASREISSAGAESPGDWQNTNSGNNGEYQTFPIALKPASGEEPDVPLSATVAASVSTGAVALGITHSFSATVAANVSTGSGGGWEIGAFVYPVSGGPILNTGDTVSFSASVAAAAVTGTPAVGITNSFSSTVAAAVTTGAASLNSEHSFSSTVAASISTGAPALTTGAQMTGIDPSIDSTTVERTITSTTVARTITSTTVTRTITSTTVVRTINEK